MAGGYITANRDDYRWFMDRKRDEPYTEYEAYLSLCMMAAYKPRVERVGMKTITVNRGEVIRTESMLADDWHWSRKQVNRFITRLAGSKECPKNCPSSVPALSRKVSQGITILVIDNYDAYVSDDDENVPDSSQECPEKGPESVPLSIKVKKKKEVITPIEDKSSISPKGDGIDLEPQENCQQEEPHTLIPEKTPASPVDDSEASNPSGCTLEPQTSIQEPRKRKQRVRSKEAQMIYDAWEYKRTKDYFDEQLDKNIAKRLKEGYTIEELVTCVKRAMPEEANTDPNYRKKASNFFGNAGYFKPYLYENFTEPEPPKVKTGNTLEEQMEAMGLAPNTYQWTPEDDLIHIPTPEEEAAKWEAFFEREKKREQEEAHEHTLVS